MALQNVGKYYPVQGTNRFQTVSFPITRAFRIDAGAGTTATHQTEVFPKGAIIHGFSARVVEAFEAAGSATVTMGFTGTDCLSSALTSATLVLDYIVGPSTTADVLPVTLKADDTFDVTIATTNLIAGKVDVFVTYTPIPIVDLSTSDFRQWVTT